MSDSARQFCQRCLRVFFDLLEGEAPSEFHHDIERRIQEMPKCQACFASYKKAASLCRQALAQAPSPEHREALLAYLRQEVRGAKGNRR